jgi:hypothetical protein
MKKIILVLLTIFSINQTYAVEDVISEVVDIKLAKKVLNKEPVEVSDTFPNTIKKVYCWTKIRAFKIPTYVVHEWYYKDKKMASVKLDIKYPLFRTWSSKRIIPSWIGNWRVIVKDEEGNIIAVKSFSIQPR